MKQVLTMDRIENSIGNGFPDISCAGKGKQFFIESKVEKSGFVYFEKFQIPWMMTRLRYTDQKGVFVSVMADNEDRKIHTFEAKHIIATPREPYKKWVRLKITDIKETLSVIEAPFMSDKFTTLAKLLIERS